MRGGGGGLRHPPVKRIAKAHPPPLQTFTATANRGHLPPHVPPPGGAGHEAVGPGRATKQRDLRRKTRGAHLPPSAKTRPQNPRKQPTPNATANRIPTTTAAPPAPTLTSPAPPRPSPQTPNRTCESVLALKMEASQIWMAVTFILCPRSVLLGYTVLYACTRYGPAASGAAARGGLARRSHVNSTRSLPPVTARRWSSETAMAVMRSLCPWSVYTGNCRCRLSQTWHTRSVEPLCQRESERETERDGRGDMGQCRGIQGGGACSVGASGGGSCQSTPQWGGCRPVTYRGLQAFWPPTPHIV